MHIKNQETHHIRGQVCDRRFRRRGGELQWQWAEEGMVQEKKQKQQQIQGNVIIL
jgi:hypothetical protein